MNGRSLARSPLLLSILLLALFLVPGNSEADDALAGVKICIDPGHGGSDPGAVNVAYNLRESDINLDVSYGLKGLLEGAAGEVVMTRTADVYLTNSDRYTFCNDEQATILISVHTNSVTDPTWDGSMALYGPRESPDLAQAIYDVMLPFLSETAPAGVNFDGWGVDKFASGVLFKSDMPAAMMEPLFMSNTEEAKILDVPIFSDGIFNSGGCAAYSCRRGQIAQAIFLGTLSYFDGQSGGSGALHVAAIDMSYEQKRSNYFVDTAVSIVDVESQPVPSAEVQVVVTYPDGDTNGYSALTDGEGVARLRFKTRQTGTYDLVVDGVVKDGWQYDSGANVVEGAQLIIP